MWVFFIIFFVVVVLCFYIYIFIKLPKSRANRTEMLIFNLKCNLPFYVFTTVTKQKGTLYLIAFRWMTK